MGQNDNTKEMVTYTNLGILIKKKGLFVPETMPPSQVLGGLAIWMLEGTCLT